MTGASEYDAEAFAIFEVIRRKYQDQSLLKKSEVLQTIEAIFTANFSSEYAYSTGAPKLAQMIYNEIHRLEQRHGRKRLPADPFNFTDFVAGITISKEYREGV